MKEKLRGVLVGEALDMAVSKTAIRPQRDLCVYV